MRITTIVILALLFVVWRTCKTRLRKKRRAAEVAYCQQEARRLFDARQITAAEMRQMMRLGIGVSPARRSNGGGYIPAPDDGVYQYAAELGHSGTAAFGISRTSIIGRPPSAEKKRSVSGQWRDEENRRHAEARQREDDYWAQRQRDDY